jgi:hypothetical protein
MQGTLLTSTLILALGAVSLNAQAAAPAYAKLTLGIQEDTRAITEYWPQTGQVPLGQLLLGGAVGVGLTVAATHLAYQMSGGGRICGDDPCGMYSGLMTLILLEPILIPAGVHIANHGRGSFGGTFFASLVAGGAALYVGNWANLGHGMLIVTPAFQIVVSALIERASENHRGH